MNGTQYDIHSEHLDHCFCKWEIGLDAFFDKLFNLSFTIMGRMTATLHDIPIEFSCSNGASKNPIYYIV